MKKALPSILLFSLLILSFASVSFSSDVTITGSAHFQCSLMTKYMEKHGYSYIDEIRYDNYLKKNLYAASDARVIVKDTKGAILGKGTTDKHGNFSVSVSEEGPYEVVVRFHDREFKMEVSPEDSQNITADLGVFSSSIVDSWIDAKLATKR